MHLPQTGKEEKQMSSDEKRLPAPEPDLCRTPDVHDALAFDELEDILKDLEELEKAMEEERD